MPATLNPRPGPFEVRFEALFDEGHALVFPCDELGRVDLDALPARARANYLYARAMVGRDYAAPRVLRVTFVGQAAQLPSETCPSQ